MRRTLKADIDMVLAGRAKMVSEIWAMTFVQITFAKSNGFDKYLDIHKKKKKRKTSKSRRAVKRNKK